MMSKAERAIKAKGHSILAREALDKFNNDLFQGGYLFVTSYLTYDENGYTGSTASNIPVKYEDGTRIEGVENILASLVAGLVYTSSRDCEISIDDFIEKVKAKVEKWRMSDEKSQADSV